MDSAKLNDWMQVIGIFAVVASLIFVGLQMKQTQEIALSSAYQARVATVMGVYAEYNNNPVYISAQAKIDVGSIDKLTNEERTVLWGFNNQTMVLFENAHYQFLGGYLPDEQWQRTLEDIRCQMSLPIFRNMTQSITFRDSFQKIVDETMVTATTDPSDCWNYILVEN